MRFQKISLMALLTLSMTSFLPLTGVIVGLFNAPQVLAQTTADRKVEADRLLQQGKQQRQSGDFSAALKSWEKALKLYLKLGDIDSLKKSVEIFHDIGYREQEAKVLSNLGNSYESMTQYKEAMEVYKKSLAIFKDLGKCNEEAGVHNNVGNIYNSLGQYKLAIDSLKESVKIYKQLGDRQNQANPLGNLGNSYYSLGQYDLAIDYYKQSLAIEQEFHRDSNNAAITLTGLGNAYIFLNKYQEAIDYYKQSLQISQKLGVRQTEANALGSLGYAYGLTRQFKESIDSFEQSLAIFKKLDDRMGTANSLNNIGDSLFLIGDLPGAEKRLREGMEVLEDIRQRLGSNDSAKVAIFDRHLSTYRTLQQVLVARQRPEEALEIAERGRARAFVELLSRRLSPQQQEIVPIPYPNLTEIKQTARTENATIVQYSVLHDSELYIWVIKPTGNISFHRSDFSPLLQSPNTSLQDCIKATRETIIQPVPLDPNNVCSSSNKLYNLLIAPIANELPQDPNAHVVFIPQDSLFLVPFAALQDSEGHYLIEKHTILTAPAIQVLDTTHKRRQQVPGKATQVLVAGNPTMPTVPGQSKALSPLPNAKTEAEAIAKIFGTQPLIGNQATKATILPQLSQARIIHLATHGILDDENAIGSSIALAPSAGDNGFLTAEEIFGLKLNAELVVLSACKTGKGRITGDGVIGLSRSIISAGVPSVIVSLWSVPDAPTADLMTEFYQQMQQNPDKAQALRQAMLKTMAQHPKPKDWAAFTLIGEP